MCIAVHCSCIVNMVTELEAISSPHKLTGDTMTKRTRRLFSDEFKLETAQLVLDQNYSVTETAQAMNVGKCTIDTWLVVKVGQSARVHFSLGFG